MKKFLSILNTPDSNTAILNHSPLSKIEVCENRLLDRKNKRIKYIKLGFI